tara:strand:+ start:417 stop:1706 length:1290 start_codon:yes stop_codon:yes gene_type:complete
MHPATPAVQVLTNPDTLRLIFRHIPELLPHCRRVSTAFNHLPPLDALITIVLTERLTHLFQVERHLRRIQGQAPSPVRFSSTSLTHMALLRDQWTAPRASCKLHLVIKSSALATTGCERQMRNDLGVLVLPGMPAVTSMDLTDLGARACSILFTSGPPILKDIESIKFGRCIYQWQFTNLLLTQLGCRGVKLVTLDVSNTGSHTGSRPSLPQHVFDLRRFVLRDSLQHLVVRHAKIEAACAQVLGIFLQRVSLLSLDLTGTRLEGDVFELLVPGLQTCAALRRLGLGENHWFGACGAEHLSGVLPDMKSLQELDVSGTALQHEGLAALCQGLAPAADLRVLNVGRAGLTSLSVKTLCLTLPALTSLTELHLADNKIAMHDRVPSFEALVRAQPGLRRVDLRGKYKLASPAVCQRLRQSMQGRAGAQLLF